MGKAGELKDLAGKFNEASSENFNTESKRVVRKGGRGFDGIERKTRSLYAGELMAGKAIDNF